MKNFDSAALGLQWFGENDGGDPAPAGKGSSATPLVDALPDDLKSVQKFHELGTAEKLARSYLEAESRLGRSITLPGKDAKPEDWGKFYSKLGRPEKAEDYSFDAVEGFEADPEFTTKMRQFFHAAGLSATQAKTVFSQIAAEGARSAQAENEARAQANSANETLLRQEWGGEYDNNLARASQFVESVAGKNGMKKLEEMGISKDPLILKLLAHAGMRTSGRPLVSGSLPGEKVSRYAYMNEGKKRP